jgi:transposase
MTTLDADVPLPDDIETAHQLVRELLATLRQQTDLNEPLRHQLEQLLRRTCGRESEKLDPNQLLLRAPEVPEAAGPEAPPGPEPAAPSPTKPPTQGHGRKPLPAGLPRKPIVHEVPPQERPCPDCGGDRACIGEEVRERLEYVPASLVVLPHVRPEDACQACQANAVIAERPPEPIAKGPPGPGPLAHVAVSK